MILVLHQKKLSFTIPLSYTLYLSPQVEPRKKNDEARKVADQFVGPPEKQEQRETVIGHLTISSEMFSSLGSVTQNFCEMFGWIWDGFVCLFRDLWD